MITSVSDVSYFPPDAHLAQRRDLRARRVANLVGTAESDLDDRRIGLQQRDCRIRFFHSHTIRRNHTNKRLRQEYSTFIFIKVQRKYR